VKLINYSGNSFLDYMNKRGFVILQIDARGTGASGGNWLAEWAPAEVKDFGEVARWASVQP
jgi:predicted acyl esterase